MDDFATKIKQLRVSQRLSVQKITEAVGCSRSTWYRYEKGEIVPSIKKIAKIAEVLDTTTAYLLGIIKEYTPDCDYEFTVYRKSDNTIVARIFEDYEGIKAIVEDGYKVRVWYEGEIYALL